MCSRVRSIDVSRNLKMSVSVLRIQNVISKFMRNLAWEILHEKPCMRNLAWEMLHGPSAAGLVDDMATKGGDLFGCRMSAGPAGSPSARHPCERVERRGVLAGWTQRGGNRAPYQRPLLPTVSTFISPGRQICRTVDFSLRGRRRCRPVRRTP